MPVNACRKLLVLSICTLFALSALAQNHQTRVAEPVPVTSDEVQVLPVDRVLTTGTCDVGGTKDPVWAIPDFLLPPERYAVIFDPATECPNCPFGLELNSVRVGFETPGDCDVQLRAFFADIDPASPPSCRIPGEKLCESISYGAKLDKAGSWEVIVPLKCPCADRSYQFVVGVVIESASCVGGGVPALQTDGSPSACVAYNDFGLGWFDLTTSYGFPGTLHLWGDTQCCEKPVNTATSSWGVIKSLFR